MVFLIDVPRLEDPLTQATNSLTPFGEELCYFLQAQGVDQNMVRSLRNYDFTETSRFGFVHTIAGSHLETEAWQRTGYCGLGRTVKGLGLDSTDDVSVDYVCSSLGNIKRDLLCALYGACKGDSGLREYAMRTGKPRKPKAAASSGVEDVDASKLRVYYPSRETVEQSRGGPNVSLAGKRLLPLGCELRTLTRILVRRHNLL